MDWSHESLWLKAKLYATRAAEQDRQTPLFGFWSALTLELLGRSALASVHPSLLADPRGDDVLYAVGFQSTSPPKSVPAKTVFNRCVVVIDNFTEDDFKSAQAFMMRRNAELHSGALAFDSFPTAVWLAEYYRLCDLLLRAQNKTLGRLFGGEEAKAARRMIRAAATDMRKRVLDSVSARRKEFEVLPEADRAERRAALPLVFKLPANGRRIECPACKSREYMEGKTVRSSAARLEEDDVVIETVALPVRFECRVCGLRLIGHSALHAAGLGGQYTHREVWDAFDYYDRGDQQPEYYEPDYGND